MTHKPYNGDHQRTHKPYNGCHQMTLKPYNGRHKMIHKPYNGGHQMTQRTVILPWGSVRHDASNNLHATIGRWASYLITLPVNTVVRT